jgi:hypothetical protein
MEPEKKQPTNADSSVTEIKPRNLDPDALLDDPDPGMTQKQNQNQERDDPLAA